MSSLFANKIILIFISLIFLLLVLFLFNYSFRMVFLRYTLGPFKKCEWVAPINPGPLDELLIVCKIKLPFMSEINEGDLPEFIRGF